MVATCWMKCSSAAIRKCLGAGAYSDGNNRPFDPSPAAGTFSPLYKGRVVDVEATFEF